jgi:hypothetical protein
MATCPTTLGRCRRRSNWSLGIPTLDDGHEFTHENDTIHVGHDRVTCDAYRKLMDVGWKWFPPGHTMAAFHGAEFATAQGACLPFQILLNGRGSGIDFGIDFGFTSVCLRSLRSLRLEPFL